MPSDDQEVTTLTPDEEQRFQRWVKKNNIRDLDHPDSHYDYRGFWKKYPEFERKPGEHLTDEFKQHGHPTFSKESQYSRYPEPGGTWIPRGDFTREGLAVSHEREDQLVQEPQMAVSHLREYLLKRVMGEQ
jgi:hypothetical protein